MKKNKILSFKQLKNGYRYNTSTLLLTHFALENGVKGKTLDVGSGCGIIGILLKAHQNSIALSLLDIQKENIALINENLKQNETNAQVFHADFKEFKSEVKFDTIVCNPPFYRSGNQKSTQAHKQISKSQNFLPLDELISRTNSLLSPKGVFYFCYESSALDEICVRLAEKKLKITKICFVYFKKGENSKLVLIMAKKSSKSPCEILPPFYVCKNEKTSKKMQKICSQFRIKSYDF